MKTGNKTRHSDTAATLMMNSPGGHHTFDVTVNSVAMCSGVATRLRHRLVPVSLGVGVFAGRTGSSMT